MLLGENGSGKTTLIRSLLQYIPYKGCILHEKSDIHSLKQRQLAALFSYVPQIKETVEDLAVEECIVSGFAVPTSRLPCLRKNSTSSCMHC